jgi:predicted nucleotidyltransferase
MKDQVAEKDRQPLLGEIARRILTVSDPERILLYGSHARGDATPDSDWDVLVIEDVERPRQRSVEIRRALRGLLVPVDIIVATPQQVERYRNASGLLYHAALEEGQTLYERHAPT